MAGYCILLVAQIQYILVQQKIIQQQGRSINQFSSSLGSSSPFFKVNFFYSTLPSRFTVLVMFLSPVGSNTSSVVSSSIFPSLTTFLDFIVLAVSCPFLLDQTEEVFTVYPSLRLASSFSSTINLSNSFAHLGSKMGLISSGSSKPKPRLEKKSSNMLQALMGVMGWKRMVSQLAFLNQLDRALYASLTQMNFLWAASSLGFFFGWYFKASFLYAFLMSSRVAFLFRPRVAQQVLRGLGQCWLKNYSSDSSTIPCSLKNRWKVESASSREYCLLSSSSQWALLFLSERTSKASEIS